MRGLAAALLPLAVALGLWQGLVLATGVPPFLLPGPDRVALALWENRVALAENAWITILEMVGGMALGALFGAATAIHLAMSDSARRILLPILVFNQAVPIFAFAPLFTLWLGYGVWSKIAVVVLIVYFPVTSTFYDGLRRTDRGLVDLARTMGAGRWRTLVHLRLPAALPAFGSGLKLAAIYAPVGAVFGELVGASKGLGYLMMLANGRTKTDLMFAAILLIAVAAVLLHAATARLARRLDAYAHGRA